MERKPSIRARENYINRPDIKEMYDRLSDEKKRYFCDVLDFYTFASDAEIDELDGLDLEADSTKIVTTIRFWKLLHPDHELYADAPVTEPQFIVRKV